MSLGGDMVACTSLCVGIVGLSSREAVANQLLQSWLDRDILYGEVEVKEKKRRKKEKKGLMLTSGWWR